MKYTSEILLLVLLAGGLVLTGCGKSSPESESGEMVLQHAMYTKITRLDPGNIRDIYSATVVSQTCETLYQYHFLKRPYELVPLLAEEMPVVSDDKLTYTVRIKKGVYFQNDKCFPGGRGRELRADDFVYAIKRIANIKYLSQNWSLFDDKIVGLDEFREYTKGFESEGARTL
jgi:ABC-type oligopeptide transport system substrate-binding subunit